MNRLQGVVLGLIALASAQGAQAEAIYVGNHISPKPYLIVPNQSDLVNPDATTNWVSHYLAGIGGTPAYSGVGLVTINTSIGLFGCSGSLLSSTVVLTAGHCVSPQGLGGSIYGASFWLPNGRAAFGADNPVNPGVVQSFDASGWLTPPSYDLATLTADVGLLKLSTPVSGVDTYSLNNNPNLLGAVFQQVGLGDSGWGSVGEDSPGFDGFWDVRKRVGQNQVDAYGDPFFSAFNDIYNPIFGGPVLAVSNGVPSSVFLSDFDSGLAQNDVFGQLASLFPGTPLAAFNVGNTGLPGGDTGSASGDSGGPEFDANGNIIGVTSFGITGAILTLDNNGFIACGDATDIDPSVTQDGSSCTNSSFGEINGYTNVADYYDFLMAARNGQIAFEGFAPEPTTLALFSMGLIGLSRIRRRNNTKA